MAATREVDGRNKIVILGLGGGLVGAAIIAYFASELSDLAEGVGQELFNADDTALVRHLAGKTDDASIVKFVICEQRPVVTLRAVSSADENAQTPFFVVSEQ